MTTEDKAPQPKNWTAPAAAVGAGLGFFTGIQALNDIPPWAQELIKTQGAELLVAAVQISLLIAIVVYLPKFIIAQTSQALAIQHVGDQLHIMTGQAGKLEEISAMLTDIKFNSGLFSDRLVRMEERLIDVKRQSDL